jgi:hypothetical protein
MDRTARHVLITQGLRDLLCSLAQKAKKEDVNAANRNMRVVLQIVGGRLWEQEWRSVVEAWLVECP